MLEDSLTGTSGPFNRVFTFVHFVRLISKPPVASLFDRAFMKFRVIIFSITKLFMAFYLIAVLAAISWFTFSYIRIRMRRATLLKQGRHLVSDIMAFQQSHHRLPASLSEVNSSAFKNWQFAHFRSDEHFLLYSYTGWTKDSVYYIDTPNGIHPAGWYLNSDNGDLTPVQDGSP